MDSHHPFILSLVFGVGIIFQSLLFISNQWTLEKMRLILKHMGISLAGMFPGKNERHYVEDIYFHITICFILFAGFIFATFKKEILPRITEASLLSYSLIFWYLFLSRYDPHSAFDRTVVLLAALPTLGTLVIAFTLIHWSFKVNLSCYIWYLILVLAISILQISFGALAFIFGHRTDQFELWQILLTGMSFTYLSASMFYLYILIPVQGKNQTKEERMQIWQEDARLMASRFVDYRMPPVQAAIILILQGGLYALNHTYRWFPMPLMVNLSVVVLPVFFSFIFQTIKPVPMEPATP